MRFNDVIANSEVKTDIAKMVFENSIPHAMLLTGAEGTGKMALALALASMIVCEDKSEEDSCGRCRACVKMSSLVHPDVHFSFPFPGASHVSDDFIKEYRSFIHSNPYGGISQWLFNLDAENKQVNINTKECRAILKKLSLQSFESKQKVLILWLPEFLRKDGNRLLKMIEEPTDDTFVILVSNKPDLILPTIISRCRLIHVKPLHDEELAHSLETNYNMEKEKAREIAYLAEGNLEKALEIKNHEIINYNEEIVSWFRICYSLKADDTVNWVENFAKRNKDEQKAFLLYTLNFLREVGRIPFLAENEIRLKEKELDSAKKIAKIVTFEQIDILSNILSKKIYHIERNANIRVLMMDTCISFKNILRQANLASNK